MAKSFKIRGISEGKTYWWRGSDWIKDESLADRLLAHEAARRVRIVNANNRFLDAEDRIVAEIVESK